MAFADEDVLDALAKGSTIDYEKWPGMLDPLLERLEYIVYNVFPMPKSPSDLDYHHPQPSSYPSQDPNSQTFGSNKENTPPGGLHTPPRPIASLSPSSERVPDLQPQSFSAHTNESLPPPLQLLLNSITSTLKTFTSKPPHTIQRLAELILHPTTHYRTLPAYLRALDRTVSVMSGVEIFPLQAQRPNGAINGGETGFMAMDHGPGSDESLGGALLTPIPWLSNASMENDNGNQGEEAMAIEEESHPVSAGEANAAQELQQQCQTATVAAMEQSSTYPSSMSSAIQHQQPTDPTSPPTDPSEEMPHARGPPIVGVEDVGLQNGQGVQMNLSTDAALSDPTTSTPSGNTNTSQTGQSTTRENDTDADGDVVVGGVRNGEGGQGVQLELDSKGQQQQTDTDTDMTSTEKDRGI